MTLLDAALVTALGFTGGIVGGWFSGRPQKVEGWLVVRPDLPVTPMVNPGAGQSEFPKEPEKIVMDAYDGERIVRATASEEWVDEEIKYPTW